MSAVPSTQEFPVLKTLMVSTSYPENARDWRGRFVADLLASVCARGGIQVAFWGPPGTLPPEASSALTPEDERWLRTLVAEGGIAHVLRARGVLGASRALGLLSRLRQVYARHPDVDVVHVNWLQNALALTGRGRRVVVSVLGSDFGLLRLPGMVTVLRSALKRHRVVLVPNATWMERRLRVLFGDIADVQTVPFGVSPEWFRVERVCPSLEKHDWIVVARLTKVKLGPLFGWGEGLFSEERRLHLLGPNQEHVTLPNWAVYHGPTHPEELRSTWFPRACGLITLSEHAEGRPQVMIEAMAAGLPVIASNLPAHRDLIRHRETGWIVRSAAGLADVLRELEDPERNRCVGETARAWVRAEVGTWDDCAERFVRIYRSLTS